MSSRCGRESGSRSTARSPRGIRASMSRWSAVSRCRSPGERGIRIGSAAALGPAQRLATVVLDKTGTLTRGAPALTDIVVKGDWREDDLLRLVAAGERASEHPLGSAVVAGAQARGLTLAQP